MVLGRVVGKIPGNQYIVVRDYLNGTNYAEGATNHVINKILDYDMELRNADVYGISIGDINTIVIDVIIENE